MENQKREVLFEKKEQPVQNGEIKPHHMPHTSEQPHPDIAKHHSSPIIKWASLAVLSLALAIIVIDTTLLNVSLKTIIEELHTDLQSIQWVITSYSLTLAALTITGGRLGDLFGRKRMFIAGAFIFALGSFIASISNSVGVLLAGESIIEGIGAALMMPATASLLVANYHGRDRALAFGVWGGVAGASSAIGPILGGWLTKNYSWRWGFRINVVIALILFIGSFIVKESRDTHEKPKLDIPGVLLSGLGMLSIVFGIIESSDYGWWTSKKDLVLFGNTVDLWGLSFVPFSLIIGAFLLHLFLYWEKKREEEGKTPLVSFKIFFNRMFTVGVLTTAIISIGLIGLIFALPVFLQSILQLNALDTGLAMLPLSITMLIVAPLSGVISNKIPLKYLILAGIVINVIGMLVLRQSLGTDITTTNLIPGLVLIGLGMGMVMAQISNITLSAVPVSQAGEASGISNTMRQVGSTLGAAIIGAALLSTLISSLTTNIQESKIIPDFAKTQIIEKIETQSSEVEFGEGTSLPANTPPAITTEIEKISKDAVVAGSKTALLFAAFSGILGFIVAIFLPAIKKVEHKAAGGH